MVRKKLPLKNTAEKNTSATVGTKNDQRAIKSGTPLDHALKQPPKYEEQRIVGVSKGVTLNQGDYQSLRVDCWLSDTAKQGESIEDAFQRVGAIVDEQLIIQVQATQKEFD